MFLSILDFLILNKMPLEKLAKKNFKLFVFRKKMLHLLLSCDVNRTLFTLQPANLKKSKKRQCPLGLIFIFFYFSSSRPSSAPLTVCVSGSVICPSRSRVGIR